MADKPKYHITYVSCNTGTEIESLEVLLQQKFKLSPERAKLFFLGEDKIATASLEKAKKFREYFLTHGVVVRIAPSVKMRPYSAPEATETVTEQTSSEATQVDSQQLIDLQTKLAKAEDQIAALQSNEQRLAAKLARFEQEIIDHRILIEDLQAEAALPSAPEELESLKAEDVAAADGADDDQTESPAAEDKAEPTAAAKPKQSRALWGLVGLIIFTASLAGAWLLMYPNANVKDLLYKIPFLDLTPSISSALHADEYTVKQLSAHSQNYIEKQASQDTSPELRASSLLHASQESNISIEGLIAVVEVMRCTNHQFDQDMSFLVGQLDTLVWDHLTADELLQYQIIKADTHKLVQLGAGDNCSTQGSSGVVAKLAFDAYIQNHLK